MKTTISVIKADIGSIGGHITPSKEVLATVKKYIQNNNKDIIDFFINHTGDDIAILMTHTHGKNNKKIHSLGWNALVAGSKKAKEQGLYGAGQDIFEESFTGNVQGMGPAVAELEFEERPGEPFLFFAADKTEPGAYNLPLYLSFADPMHCPGLMLSPSMDEGFRFVIIDIKHTDAQRTIELNAPEDLYDIAALLRDNSRFIVQSIWSRKTREQAVAVSAVQLKNIDGKLKGKDDPIHLVRVQKQFPSTGEIISPYSIGHYVPGMVRGSHYGPLMPCKQGTSISYFDGAIVTCAAFSIHEGKLTEPNDPFDHPFWEHARNKVSDKAQEMRKQGFSGPAMLHTQDLEYGGIAQRMEKLDKKFKVKK